MTALSGRNLYYMRAFAEAWPGPQVVQQAVFGTPTRSSTYLTWCYACASGLVHVRGDPLAQACL